MYRRMGVAELQLEELGLTHRKNQPMLLRRLAVGPDISALQTLVSVIEPVKEYRRYRVRPQTMLSPLTGLVDAAQPDAPAAMEFNTAVDEMLAGVDTARNLSKLRSMVAGWQSAESALLEITDRSPALAEARSLAADFKRLNLVILEALDALGQGSTQNAEWRDGRMKALDEVAKPKAALEFVTVSHARKLVAVASGSSAPGTGGPVR
jgi:hexosaminidase